MPIVTVNGTEVEVEKGTTLLQAAALAGHEVPHFCYHPALSRPANCRMCLVEVEKAPKLLPGCYNPVNDGMVMHTESDRVIRARKAVLEFILINHPVDCPICDKAGECKLQDYYFAYDAQESRMRSEKNHKVKAYPIGPKIVYDGERCILCTRCIRFCEEITETNELTLVERGDMIEVRTFPGLELDNDYSLCTVDVCPVGALTSRDFRFKCRVWLMTSTESICTGCATGCNVHLDHFRNEVQRYRPRYNPEVNDYWMCDQGRMSYKDIHEHRILTPKSNDVSLTWHEVTDQVRAKLTQTINAHGAASVGFVISPQLSCEDLFLARTFYEQTLESSAKLYVSGLPDGKQDDLLIHADKNPNRRGIEAVFAGLEGNISAFESLSEDLASGAIKALYMLDARWPVDAQGEQQLLASIDHARNEAGSLDVFILQSMQGTQALIHLADIVLPACSHAEKDGTFINKDGIGQPFAQGFLPHGSSLPDWQILLRIGKAMGVTFNATFLHQIQSEMFTAFEQAEEKKAELARREAEKNAKAAENPKATQEGEPALAVGVDDWESVVSEALDDAVSTEDSPEE